MKWNTIWPAKTKSVDIMPDQTPDRVDIPALRAMAKKAGFPEGMRAVGGSIFGGVFGDTGEFAEIKIHTCYSVEPRDIACAVATLTCAAPELMDRCERAEAFVAVASVSPAAIEQAESEVKALRARVAELEAENRELQTLSLSLRKERDSAQAIIDDEYRWCDACKKWVSVDEFGEGSEDCEGMCNACYETALYGCEVCTFRCAGPDDECPLCYGRIVKRVNVEDTSDE